MPLDDSSRVVGKQYFVDQATFATKPVVPDASFPGTKLDPAFPAPTTAMRHRIHARYSQGNVAATTETRGLAIVHGTTGGIVAVYVSNAVRATGAATVTVDVRKNGVTVLTGVVTLDSTHPAAGAGYATVVGNLVASPTLVKGDVIDAVITATAGGGVLPTEVQVEVVFDEDPI